MEIQLFLAFHALLYVQILRQNDFFITLVNFPPRACQHFTGQTLRTGQKQKFGKVTQTRCQHSVFSIFFKNEVLDEISKAMIIVHLIYAYIAQNRSIFENVTDGTFHVTDGTACFSEFIAQPIIISSKVIVPN